MPLPRKRLAVLHIGKKQLQLSDEQWSDLLMSVAGAESSRELDEHGFEAMMEALEAAGFKSDFGKAHGGNLRRWDMATPGQVALIKDIWAELHGGELDEAALDKWLSRFGADSLRFFTLDQARRAIAGLKNWKGRKAAKDKS